jgi:two-component system sensor histidine kinase ChvG
VSDRLPRWRRLLRTRPSRIGLRLLAFNLLLVFLPVAGVLYLDVYETRLLEIQERSMVQQGRLVAAALGGVDSVTAESAGALLSRLGQRGEARIRVYDSAGALIADSVRVPDLPPVERAPDASASASEYANTKGIRERALYRIGAWLVRIRRAFAGALRPVLVPSLPTTTDTAREIAPGAEVRSALDGRYGASVRPTPGQRSLTLYSAVPIRRGGTIVGAAVVSQSTFRILQALYDVRLRIFEIVMASIAAAVVIGLVLSTTIVRPLVRLRRAALALTDRRATPSEFLQVKRSDEIGDLARALAGLTARLDDHIKLLESFAGDVAHEFKNPLAAIRVAAEVLASTDDSTERQRLLGLLTHDVDRLERLVSGVRELARIDAQLAHEEMTVVPLEPLIAGIVGAFGQRHPETRYALSSSPGELLVRASPDRLAQVFENLLENATSFAPPGTTVDVSLSRERETVLVLVQDRGPGFPPAHVDRVFTRFFSYRPGAQRKDHMGLGLSIARAIVEGYGGTITARNRDDGGAVIAVKLTHYAEV